MQTKHLIVLDVVGLSLAHCARPERMPHLARLMAGGSTTRLRPVFPAVTLPVQASLTTGLPPARHGVVANGFYFRERCEVAFWEQAAGLVAGERVWDRVKKRRPELVTAALFMQNSLYAGCDVIVTPRPLHTEEGLIPWCYSKPVGWYEELAGSSLGEFNLMHYWGPLAGIGSSRWIAGAAVETLRRFRPNLLFVYLPHLDYCTQRLGPESPAVLDELALVDAEVGRIVAAVEALGMAGETTFLVHSEYALQEVNGDVAINRILRRHGFLAVRDIRGREYLDLELSEAFAMVDHQVAHIFVKPGWEGEARALLENTPGIDMVLGAEERKRHGIDHPGSGELIAVSARDRWFSYPWWEDREREPDFAGHVDIHRKPGYDPLELFLEPGTRRVSQDTGRIRGSHGYPPLEDRDLVPLAVSGPGADGLSLPSVVEMTELADLIERLLG